MWFQTLMGFQEKNPDQVRSNCGVEGDKLVSLVNGKQYTFGRLETPSLADLRSQSKRLDIGPGKIHLSERVADVQELHMDPKNAHALFQVASQFNLLEMLGPNRTPEEGVGIYSFDRTQGPACAIAAGAGTIYRNYFVEVNGTIGQRVDKQIDCLADLGALLGNHEQRIWNMQNGYVLPSGEGLKEVAKKLKGMGEEERDILRSTFGNRDSWIFSAIRRAITLFKNFPLEVVFVSYGSSNSKLNEFILGS
ncbi:MAG: hypothetical protein AAGA10_31415 [Bacteroidota bacterium]